MTSQVLAQYVFPPLARIIEEYKNEVLAYINIYEYKSIQRRSSDEPENFVRISVLTIVILPRDLAYFYQSQIDSRRGSVTIITNPFVIDEFLYQHPTGIQNLGLLWNGMTALEYTQSLF